MISKKWIALTLVTASAIVTLSSTASAQVYYNGRFTTNNPYVANSYNIPYYGSVVAPSYYTPTYTAPFYSNYAMPAYPTYAAPTYSYQSYRYSTPYESGYYGTRYESPSAYGPGGSSYRYWQRRR